MDRLEKNHQIPEKQRLVRVLIVTRESLVDRRYGLGKSLQPLLEIFDCQAVKYRYLTQDDVDQRSWDLLHRFHSRIVKLLRPILRGTEVANVAWGVLERVNMGRLAARIAVAEGWTHIHCHDPLIAWGLHWCLRLKRNSSHIRWGITEHGFGCYVQAIHEDGARLGRHVMNWMRQMEARVLFAAHWVIFPTHLARMQLQRDLALPQIPPNFYVIPHPVSKLTLPDRKIARKRLGWTDTEWVWLAVGRLVPLKAFELLIHAFAQLSSSVSTRQRLHIAGGGDTTSLVMLARTFGVADRISIDETDYIADYYAAADAYISTSRTESFGMANLEALTAGLPTLTTAVGGVPEVVGDAAILMPTDAPEVWATLMQHLMEFPGECEWWSCRALMRAQQWPSAAEVAGAYLALYVGEPVPKVCLRQSTRIPLREVYSSHRPLFQGIEPLRLDDINRALIFAPHADDEVIGCGGLVALLVNRGVPVQVCFVSDGELGDPEGRMHGSTVVEHRRAEAHRATTVLGSLSPRFMGLPDGGLGRVGDLSERLEAEIIAFRPNCILLPAECDAHSDHVAVACAGRQAARRAAQEVRLLFYELWTPLPINRLLDISDIFSKKIEALACYELPLSYVDYQAGAQGLAQYRGIRLPQGRGLAEGYLELPYDPLH